MSRIDQMMNREILLTSIYKKWRSVNLKEILHFTVQLINIHSRSKGIRLQQSGEMSIENQLIGVIIDLFIAGAETTSGSIGFALLYLLHHPEIQQKIQKELDQVCGDSLPQLAHRSRFSLYNCFIITTMFLVSTFPLPLFCALIKFAVYGSRSDGSTASCKHHSVGCSSQSFKGHSSPWLFYS